MSRRRELARRIAALTDIAGIMSAMKTMAVIESRLLQGFLDSQRRMAAGIEAAAADFLAWHGEFAALGSGGGELCVLVGSEQGFCRDFNEAIVERARSLGDGRPLRWALVGERLGAKLGEDARAVLRLPGAVIADEVPAVLLRLTQRINTLLAADAMGQVRLSVLYHSEAAGEIRLRRLLPLGDLPLPPGAASHAADLNLSPTEFFSGLSRHYLYAALNEVLYSSLAVENRQRQLHMDRALQRLEDDTTRLRIAYNAQRQEEITEEIEILLLSADMLTQPRHSAPRAPT